MKDDDYLPSDSRTGEAIPGDLDEGARERQLQRSDDDDAKRPPRKTAVGVTGDRSPLLQIVDRAGRNMGTFSVRAALAHARENGCRLFLVKPEASPPVATFFDEVGGEMLAIKISPPSTCNVAPISLRYPIVLHISLDQFRDFRTAEDVANRLAGLMTAYLDIDVDSYFPNGELQALAQEVWMRWVSSSINQ